MCGAELEYTTVAAPMRCALCGSEQSSTARCRAGHFVCDACHSGTAKDVIERACLASTATDPVALATGLMQHPKVKMHGPEHHFLVPAALLTAYDNLRGDPSARASRLREARRRAETVVGGMCGFHGACGAAIGIGIFVSLVTDATPLAREAWSLSNLATSEALAVIARRGGPRCCKRDTWLAILAAVRFARAHLGVTLPLGRRDPCGFSGKNRECLERRCPFYRGGAAAPA